MATAADEHGSDFEETMFCEPCFKDGSTVEADGFCSDCSDYLCSTCIKYHKRLAKDHTLFDKSNMPQDFCFERCSVHPNDLVKFYCPECEDTACKECLQLNHDAVCSEFKHIPLYIQSLDIYSEFKEIKKSLNEVEEEVNRMEEEANKNLKQVSLNRSDILKAVNCRKKYIKERIEHERNETFKTLDEERVEVIRKLDERQNQRKQRLFEQQKRINKMIKDEVKQLDDKSKLYPLKIINIVSKGANIKSKLESFRTELINRERQGRKTDIFLAIRRVKRNMKTFIKDIDDAREENTARCLSFRPNVHDISIDALENISLGSLTEESQQIDNGDTTKVQQGASNSPDSTEVDTTMENACSEMTPGATPAHNKEARTRGRTGKQSSQPTGKKLTQVPEICQPQWSPRNVSDCLSAGDRQSPRSARNLSDQGSPENRQSPRPSHNLSGWGSPENRQSPWSSRTKSNRGTAIDRQSPSSSHNRTNWGTPENRQSSWSSDTKIDFEAQDSHQSPWSSRDRSNERTPESRQSPWSSRDRSNWRTPESRQSPWSSRDRSNGRTPESRQSPWSSRGRSNGRTPESRQSPWSSRGRGNWGTPESRQSSWSSRSRSNCWGTPVNTESQWP